MTIHRPQPFDPYPLLAKARKGLSVGEVEALSIYIQGLERALRHHKEFQHEAASDRSVRVTLNTDSSGLLVEFPGSTSHTVSLPLARPDLALDFLVRSLRERRGQAAFVGTPGAPTEADLIALARATTRKPSNLRPAPKDVTLEDLGL